MRSIKPTRLLRRAPNKSSARVIAEVNWSVAGTEATRRATARSGRGRSTAEMVSVSNRYANELLELRCRSIGGGIAFCDDCLDIGVDGVPITERTEERQQPTGSPRDRQVGPAVPQRSQLGDRPTMTQDHRPLAPSRRFEQTPKIPLCNAHGQTVRLCHKSTIMTGRIFWHAGAGAAEVSSLLKVRQAVG